MSQPITPAHCAFIEDMTMTNPISNTDDVIDSRDVIARIEYLREELADLESEADNDTNAAVAEAKEALADWQNEYGDELQSLEALASEAEGYAPDWNYGSALIRDDYFQEYAEELANDIGAIDRNPTWPCNFIDWEAAAEALKQDYTCVEFDGVDYWIR